MIPAADWIAVQKRLGVNKSIRTAKHDCGLLKGVLRCKCGSRMDIRTYTKNNITFSYYYCANMARQGKQKCNSGYIRIEGIDQSFLNQLRRLRLNPDGLKLRRASEDLPDTKTLRNRIRALDDSIRNLTAAMEQALDTSAIGYIIRKISELDKEKHSLEISLQKAELRILSARSEAEIEAEIYQSICYLLDNFETIDYRGKTELIRKIVKKCILDTETKDLRILF